MVSVGTWDYVYPSGIQGCALVGPCLRALSATVGSGGKFLANYVSITDP